METLALTGFSIAAHTMFGQMIFDTYSVMKGSVNHPVVKATLDQIDLEADLQVIEALLVQIGKIPSDQDPIAICLNQVKEMINLIKFELEQINEELINHQQKYFASWRTPNYVGYLNNVVRHKKILDQRVEMLLKLLRLQKK